MDATTELPVRCRECARSAITAIDNKCDFCRDLKFPEEVLCHLNRCIQESADFACHAFRPILKLAGSSEKKGSGLAVGSEDFFRKESLDKDGENHTFHFQTRLFGDKVHIQALEIRDSEPKGYEFSVYGDAEDDLFALFAKLVERVRCALERRHIEPSDLTRYRITDQGIVRGHITWDDDTDGEVPCLVIDARSFHGMSSVGC